MREVSTRSLQGKCVAISISENEDLHQYGLTRPDLDFALAEICRALLDAGANLLYGGDLREDGFARQLAVLSDGYRSHQPPFYRIFNYITLPEARRTSANELGDFLDNHVGYKVLSIPDHLPRLKRSSEYKPEESITDHHYAAECFTAMRRKISEETFARVAIGGRMYNYGGYYPGVAEEVYHSIVAGKAVYLSGGFGGVTQWITDCIGSNNANRPAPLPDDVMITDFRAFAADRATMETDPDFLHRFFTSLSWEQISELNGLSPEDNHFLARSTDIREIAAVIREAM